jgi:hypothetical protein
VVFGESDVFPEQGPAAVLTPGCSATVSIYMSTPPSSPPHRYRLFPCSSLMSITRRPTIVWEASRSRRLAHQPQGRGTYTAAAKPRDIDGRLVKGQRRVYIQAPTVNEKQQFSTFRRFATQVWHRCGTRRMRRKVIIDLTMNCGRLNNGAAL